MAIGYHCRHCKTEIGSIPFESARDTLRQLEALDKEEKEQYLTIEEGGAITVRTICEQCEQALKSHPDYYTFTKWLQ